MDSVHQPEPEFQVPAWPDPNRSPSYQLLQSYIKSIGRDGYISKIEYKASTTGKKKCLESLKDYEARIDAIGSIFDKMVALRETREKSSSQSSEQLGVLYQSSAPAHEFDPKLSQDPKAEFGTLPTKAIHQIARCLDHKSLLSLRLVCRGWSKSVLGSNAFLERTSVVLDESLELVERTAKGGIKWRAVKCRAMLPTPENYSAKTYHQMYLSSLLAKEKSGGPQVWLIGVTTIILEGVEIIKETFFRWITSCRNLSALEFISCTVTKSKCSYTPETLQKSLARLNSLKLKALSLKSAFELGKLILTLCGALKTLEIDISQQLEEESSGLKQKTLENEAVFLFGESYETNRKTIRLLDITLMPFEFDGILPLLWAKFGTVIAPNLETFHFKIKESAAGNNFILDSTRIGIEDLEPVLKNLINSSMNLKSIDIPFWTFADFENPNTFLASGIKLKEIGAQFIVKLKQDQIDTKALTASKRDLNQNFINSFTIKQCLMIDSLKIYGTMAPEKFGSLINLKRPFPWLYHLEVHSQGGFGNREFHEVLENYRKLRTLIVTGIKGLSDVALLGLEPEVLLKIKARTMRRSEVKRIYESLSTLERLRILRLRGEMSISDVGILYSVAQLPNLEVLEMSGSALDISFTGLSMIGQNCPLIRSVTLDICKETVSDVGIQEFQERLPMLKKNGAKLTRI